MALESRIPIIPSVDLEKSLRLWVDGLGFHVDSEMREDGKLTFARKYDIDVGDKSMFWMGMVPL